MVGLDNPLHIAILLVILLLVFGAKRLPELGRSLGSGLRGFKESISGEPTAEQTATSPSQGEGEPRLTGAGAGRSGALGALPEPSSRREAAA
jgi:sec-independent protein translocase protein TatA